MRSILFVAVLVASGLFAGCDNKDSCKKECCCTCPCVECTCNHVEDAVCVYKRGVKVEKQ